LLGSVLGAHPYPTMVRDFHRVIGREARAQILKAEGKLPAAVIACVGGGSNAIGIFFEFLKDKKVRLIGVEAGGRGEGLGEHAARFSIGPEHAALRDAGRAEYVPASDAEALEATTLLARTEGIIPALESAHAVAEAVKRAPQMKKGDVVIVNISGRGDKDIGIMRESLSLD
jgi:tryptophan synthase beta chain